MRTFSVTYTGWMGTERLRGWHIVRMEAMTGDLLWRAMMEISEQQGFDTIVLDYIVELEPDNPVQLA